MTKEIKKITRRKKIPLKVSRSTPQPLGVVTLEKEIDKTRPK